MKPSTKELLWGVALAFSALPGCLGVVAMASLASGGITWGRQAQGGTLLMLHLLLLPFYVTLLIWAVAKDRRDRASRPQGKRPFGVPLPLWAVGFVMSACGVTSSFEHLEATPDISRREPEPTACRNVLRDASLPLAASYKVLVFDRVCPSAPRYTVNVSIADEIEPIGPGNVFVVEAAEASAEAARKLTVYAFPPQPGRNMEVLYDRSARVLVRRSPVNGLAIDFKADSFALP